MVRDRVTIRHDTRRADHAQADPQAPGTGAGAGAGVLDVVAVSFRDHGAGAPGPDTLRVTSRRAGRKKPGTLCRVL